MIPKISICIPTYNRIQFLQKALISISNNLSSDHVELVISDNKPSDEMRALIEEFNHVLPIRYYPNRNNIGAIKNVFRAISLAEGDYVWLFSDDDVLIDGSIKYLDGFISSNPDVDYIYFSRNLVDMNLNQVINDTQPNGINADMIFSSGKELFYALDGQMPGIMAYLSSTIIRRKLWEKYCTRLGEPYGGFHHLRIILKAIREKKCAILCKPGILCRLENSRETSAKVWFDEQISVFQLAKELGYDSNLCDKNIQIVINSFSKMFVVNKASGQRDDNILSAVKKLGVSHLLIKRQHWYLLSFMPSKILNPMMRLYFLIRSLFQRMV